MIKLTIFLAAFMAVAASAYANEKVVMCYFGSWAVYRPGAGKFAIENINPHLCTHLIYTFIGLNADGTVRVLDSWQDLPDNWGKDGFGRFNQLREQSPKTKTLIAIGGWNEGSIKYSQVAANPQLRATFVKSVVAFLKKYNFDGFDLDWEYPNQRGGVPADKENFIHMLRELKQAFVEDGFLLTAAVGAAESSASQSYNIPEMSKYLDYINVMSYDFNGAWSKQTGLNAPLYRSSQESGNQAKLNVDTAINYWLDQGAPASKIVLGVPFYGRAFTLADPNNNGIGAPATGPGTAGPYTREGGMLGYNEICEMFNQGGWTVKRHPEHRVPYAFKGNQWFGFDDVDSIREKAEYVNKKNLAGAMLWSIETDDFSGKCGEEYPLLRTLNHVLRSGAPVPTSAPRPNPPVTNPSVTNPPVTKLEDIPNGICVQAGYVRDPQNCNKFYYCQRSAGSFIIIPYKCPPGLVFDTTITACNYPHAVPGCH